mmetsp:Transcript_107709/g.246684  ORF Transcript_107709/g.246684 Transcript_107709/m.246684 type:complete len:169 (+) Transcript_107709:65-571(+)
MLAGTGDKANALPEESVSDLYPNWGAELQVYDLTSDPGEQANLGAAGWDGLVKKLEDHVVYNTNRAPGVAQLSCPAVVTTTTTEAADDSSSTNAAGTTGPAGTTSPAGTTDPASTTGTTNPAGTTDAATDTSDAPDDSTATSGATSVCSTLVVVCCGLSFVGWTGKVW